MPPQEYPTNIIKREGQIAFSSFRTGIASTGQPRARDPGVPCEGAPEPRNAITDVKGVEVGHSTIVSGEGRREVGKGPVRYKLALD